MSTPNTSVNLALLNKAVTYFKEGKHIKDFESTNHFWLCYHKPADAFTFAMNDSIAVKGHKDWVVVCGKDVFNTTVKGYADWAKVYLSAAISESEYTHVYHGTAVKVLHTHEDTAWVVNSTLSELVNTNELVLLSDTRWSHRMRNTGTLCELMTKEPDAEGMVCCLCGDDDCYAIVGFEDLKPI